MDIISYSKNKLSSGLSNFAEYHFELDGIKIRSMESFLQSLKLKNKKDQEIICSLPGYKAKLMFKEIDWANSKNKDLYWQGKIYNRFRDEYQKLLDRAYEALYNQNEEFKKILKETKDEKLTHKIGQSNTSNTILTEYEFISRLEKLRTYGYITHKKVKPLF